MFSFIIRRAAADPPDGLRRHLVPLLPLLRPARRPGDADRRRRQPHRRSRRDRAGEGALRPQRPAVRAVRGLLGARCCTGTSASRSPTAAASTTSSTSKAPRSIRLAIWATLIEIVVGISVGLISAVKRYSLTDKLTTIVTAAASAIPVFVLGFVLQYVFAVVPEQARLAGVDAPAHVRPRAGHVVRLLHPDR